MRILAIDYGDAHTGVAVSDLTGLLAGYTEVIHTRKEAEVLRRLGELIREYGVEELVLGYPKNMDGTLGPRAEKAEAFSHVLEEAFSLPAGGDLMLEVRLEISEAGEISVLCWRTVYSGGWDVDDTITLWDGD